MTMFSSSKCPSMHKAPSIFLSRGHQSTMCFLVLVFCPTSPCCSSLPLARPYCTPSSPPSLLCGTVRGERNREGPGLLNLRRTLFGKKPRVEGVLGVGGGFSKGTLEVDPTSPGWPRLCPLTGSNVRCMVATNGKWELHQYTPSQTFVFLCWNCTAIKYKQLI